MYTALVPETVPYIKFHIKTYSQSSVSICNLLYFIILYHLFWIIYGSIFYDSKITPNYWFISKTINVWGNFVWKCLLYPWNTLLYNLPNIHWTICTYCFSFFSVTAAFEVTSCIFILKCFNCSNYCVTLPFLLCHNIGQYSHMEMVKR